MLDASVDCNIDVSVFIYMLLLNVLVAGVERGDVETKLGGFVLLSRVCLSALLVY